MPMYMVGSPASPFAKHLILPLLNRVLARQIEEGLVDFLAQRTLAVHIADLGVEWRFSLTRTSGRIIEARGDPDATIRADGAALLLLAARRIDPDTLFFQRRLMVEGDAELGLQAKNLLDTIEDEDLPAPLAQLLSRAGRFAERWS